MSDGPVSRTILPIPDVPHIGLTTYDAKDPDTSYPPIRDVRPPQDAPNVLVVLIDDVGFGASSAFGGPCQTPNFDKLASGGLKYTRSHTTALCSPTRAALSAAVTIIRWAWAVSPKSPRQRRGTARCCRTPRRRWRSR